MKSCPYCAESIQDEAAKCRYCGEWLDPSKRPAWSESGPSPRATAPAAFTPSPAIVANTTPSIAALAAESLIDDAPPPPPPDFAGADVDADAAVPTAVSSALGEAPSWVRTGAFPAASASAAASSASTSSTGSTAWTPPATSARPPPPPNGSLQGLLHAPLHAHPGPSGARPGTAVGLPPLAPLHPSIGSNGRAGAAPGFPHPAAHPVDAGAAAEALDELPLTILEPSSRSDLRALRELSESRPAATHEPSQPPLGAPAPAAGGVSDFERAFFGGGDAFADDLESDSVADGDPFASHVAAAPRPALPTRQVLVGAGLLVLVLVLGFRDRLFGGGGGSEATAEGGAIAGALPHVTRAREGAAAKVEEARKAEEAKKAEAAKKAAEAPPPVDPEFENKLAEARKAYEKHKLKAAQAGLDELSRTQPSHPEVLLLTAQIQLERGDLTGSMQSARRCVEVDAKQADCWLTLGVLEQNNKADEAAIKAYETYLELAPEGRYARDATTQLGRLKK